MPEFPKIELLKEEDENIILNTLYEILENGGKLPADTKIVQLLTLAAIRQMYSKVCNTANATRTLQVGLGIVAFTVFVLATAFVALHPSELMLVFKP